jgi:hypothetical protein
LNTLTGGNSQFFQKVKVISTNLELIKI